jgi:glycerol uptake facilitator-like aquaporin
MKDSEFFFNFSLTMFILALAKWALRMDPTEVNPIALGIVALIAAVVFAAME